MERFKILPHVGVGPFLFGHAIKSQHKKYGLVRVSNEIETDGHWEEWESKDYSFEVTTVDGLIISWSTSCAETYWAGIPLTGARISRVLALMKSKGQPFSVNKIDDKISNITFSDIGVVIFVVSGLVENILVLCNSESDAHV